MNKSKTYKELLMKVLVLMTIFMIGIQITMVDSYANQQTTAATNVDSVTAPIKSLTTLLEAIVGAIGVIIVVYNISKLGPAISAHDNSAISQAVMGIAGGGIMALVTTVLAILGF